MAGRCADLRQCFVAHGGGGAGWEGVSHGDLGKLRASLRRMC